jgi:hypothetical protein
MTQSNASGGFEEEKRKRFFFEKKKQKTFISWAWALKAPTPKAQGNKSLFGSFSSEKELLS